MGDMRYRVNNKIKGVIIVVFAAVTEQHREGDLKTTEFYISQF